MKKLSLVAFVAAAALAVPFASAQVTVNGKSPQTAKFVKVKESKATKTVGSKKRRHKFLGIF